MQQQHDKRTQNTLATIMFCHNALCTATHHFSPEDVLNSISDFYWIDSRNDKVKSDFICICVRKRNSSWWSDASFVFGFNACLISLCPGCGCRHQWFCAVLFTKGPVGHNAVGSFVLMHLRAHHKGQPSCNQTIVGHWSLLTLFWHYFGGRRQWPLNTEDTGCSGEGWRWTITLSTLCS